MAEQNAAWQETLIEGTDDQKKALTSDSLLTVVSAGAGTGKTMTLAQRFAWLLANDRTCGVDQILVLTFTEKAAREMYDGIKKTLVKWHDKSPDKKELDDLKKHLQKSIDAIDDANISTIHSFAMKIIRESGLVLDLDPTSAIVPAPTEDIFWNDFADALDSASLDKLTRMGLLGDLWADRAKELFGEKDFIDFVNEYGPQKLADMAKNAAGKLGSATHSVKDVNGNTASEINSPDHLWDFTTGALELAKQSHIAHLTKIRDEWHDCVFPNAAEAAREDKGSGFGKSLCDFINEWPDEKVSEKSAFDFCDGLLKGPLKRLSGGKAVQDAVSDALGKELKEWREENKDFLQLPGEPSEEERRINTMLNRTAALGWHCWDVLKKNSVLMSMNDLIRFAYETVSKDAEYRHRFRHILVDEFQDTDPLQDKLIKSLWTGFDAAEDEQHNTLFIVGDLKQSIYRFRHADLTLFGGYIRLAKNCTDSKKAVFVPLSNNFRSRTALLDTYNSVFKTIWLDGMGGSRDLVYEELLPPDEKTYQWSTERNEGTNTPALEIIEAVPPQPKDGKAKLNSADARAVLYSALAEKIKKHAADGVQVWDKKPDKDKEYYFRNAKYSDFAVLVPKRTSYQPLEDAFIRHSLPYVLCTSKNYYGRYEITVLADLASLLANPRDTLALASWIASPFSGCEVNTAERLLDKASTMKKDKSDCIDLAAVVQKELPDVWNKIEGLRKTALLRGLSDALLQIEREPSFLEAYEPSQRSRINANISYLAATAAEYEHSQGPSLAGCALYIQQSVQAAVQKEEPDVTDTEQDAVRVMTIHSSKGLEFPIVVLTDTGGSSKARNNGSMDISLRYGVTAKKIPSYMLNDENKAARTITDMYFSKDEKQAEAAEKERLWYVGMTRAKEKLILCGKPSDGGKQRGFLDSVLDVVKSNDKLSFEIARVDEMSPSDPSLVQGNSATSASQAKCLLPKEATPAKLARIAASAYAMISWCPNAYRIAYRQRRDMQWTSDGGEESGGSGFGSLAHWILSKWNFKTEDLDSFVPENLSQGAERRVPSEFRAEFKELKTRKDLRKILTAYAESDEGRKLAAYVESGAYGLQRETPFRVQDGELLLVGSTDIFWEDEDGIHIRDWKTTSEASAPSEYYEGQLDFYVCAKWICGKQSGMSEQKIDAAINYLRLDDTIKFPKIYSDAEIETIRKKIHTAAVTALSGSFDAAAEHCSACPWEKDCAKKCREIKS